jgi:CDP-2,3-bis-(O-geranylgeranyl)-sn-glycerol synthase
VDSSAAISLTTIALSALSALWLMIPAYVPNPVAAISGGGTPIDLGRRFPDGRRVLGDGKTIRGFVIGVLAGIIVGLIQIQAAAAWDLAFLPQHTFVTVILFSVGALLGDMVKSFFKRRVGKARGEKWPIADQYDLVAGALLLTALFSFQWLIDTLTLLVVFWIIVFTPLLHRAVNVIGYLTGVKDVPW